MSVSVRKESAMNTNSVYVKNTNFVNVKSKIDLNVSVENSRSRNARKRSDK